MKLERLAALKVEIDAIVSQKALPFNADLKLRKLGKLAVARIEYSMQDIYTKIGSIEQEVMVGIVEKNGRAQTEEILAACEEREDYKAAIKEEEDGWHIDAKDFEFDIVQIKESDVKIDQFKESKIMGSVYRKTFRVNPYMSLHALIEEGFINIIEQ
jgi:hypothetical protein